ncbi:MAG: HPr family phosphocarrier protein [Phycisphaerae bacterium]|nr:HPr family phosphocarrier protein [Phycisphaerae bacterium]
MASSPDTVKGKITILNRMGLHARPAMSLVDLANRHQASLTIRKGAEAVDGKSIMQVMMLAATRGTELEVEAVGPDAEQVISALKELVERRFDEE